MNRLSLVVVAVALSACAMGPRRQTLPEYLGTSQPQATSAAETGACWAEPTGCEASEGGAVRCRGLLFHGQCAALATPGGAVASFAPAEAPEDSNPFTAGLWLGAGVSLGSGEVLPAQLAAGSLRVVEFRGRGLNLLALGGVSQTAVSRARLAWGLGLGYQITREGLPYEVDLGAGLLWLKGEESPAAVFGFVLTP